MQKKLLTIAAALAVCLGAQAADQSAKFGVTGGFTTTQSVQGFFDPGFDNTAITTFYGGITFKTGPLAGFVLQPSLIYTTRSTAVDESQTMTTGYFELPVQVQWGFNVLGVRPYVFLEPYVGYALNNTIENLNHAIEDIRNSWQGVDRLEYGLGVGAGLTLFNTLQLSARYSWGVGTLSSASEDFEKFDLRTAEEELIKALNGEGSDNDLFNGLSVSLSIFF